KTMTYGYDTLGRRTSVTDPRCGTTKQIWTENGWIDHIIDPAGNVAANFLDHSLQDNPINLIRSGSRQSIRMMK
ncbi:MAG: hypothetical protein V1793_07795, partial [Pseudomonadota bacterium]